MKTFTHKQEIWSKEKCAKMSKHSPVDAFGNHPPKGIISASGSAYVGYGQTMRYNGGTVIDGEWYEAEAKPLPAIHTDYEFFNLVSWGMIIRKKTEVKR